MKRLVFIFPMLLFFYAAHAQSVINGSVKNKKGEPLAATMTVQAKGNAAISAYSATDDKGNYTLTYKGTADSITVTATGMNIGKHSKTTANHTQQVNFIIDEKALELKEVTTIMPKIKLKGDTLDYLVSAYTDQSDRVIGDVLKKMPGIKVSSDGGITYNGKAINKFYIENRDMLHGRYGIATNNIAAKDVATVQVLENHQPLKILRDKIWSDQAAINLKLKDSAKGTLALSGLAGVGYQPWMWNAELVSTYFSKALQNMCTYKSNNSGDDVASEFRTHYDYERTLMAANSLLSIQSPSTPPVSQKRYLNNQSHAITTNELFGFSEETEMTVSTFYYNDRIEKEGYSLLGQYLPGDSTLLIEEQISSQSKINNAELAMHFTSNAADYFLSENLNVTGNWNHDTGFGLTRSNSGNLNEKIAQYLDKPAFTADNTLNFMKNIKNNSYKIFFSTGYGRRAHTLTVSPVNYFGDGNEFNSLSQHVLSKDFSSVLRLTYGLKLGKFNLDYNLWGRTDIQNMETELLGKDSNDRITLSGDSLKNNLGYNIWQAGFNQNYTFKSETFGATIQLPITNYTLAIDDRIPSKETQHNLWIINPSASVRYSLTPELSVSSGAGFSRSYGDMASSYTGYIMHSYRSLIRNSVDRLFEARSGSGNLSFSYRNVFKILFINGRVNYSSSWKNLLYGYNYQGIMNVKTMIDRPTRADGYGINGDIQKGLNFWSGTLRVSGGYSTGKNELLIQDEILDYRSQGYNANGSFYITPVPVLSLNYSLSWNQSKSYAIERSGHFPAIRVTSQNIKTTIFPHKTTTLNLHFEHQYNSAASSRNTSFADVGVNFKYKQLNLELEVNNIFNSKQYVSASYSDISTYYYCYNLRPVNVLLKARFKLK